MKKKVSQGEDTVHLPRSAKYFHIIVNKEMHYALRQHAAKHDLTLASAAARLIRQGIFFELNQLNIAENRASLKQTVNELIRKEMKGRTHNV